MGMTLRKLEARRERRKAGLSGWKIQWLDERSFAWRDIQRTVHSREAALDLVAEAPEGKLVRLKELRSDGSLAFHKL